MARLFCLRRNAEMDGRLSTRGKMRRAGAKAKSKARKKNTKRRAGLEPLDVAAVRQEATNLIAEEAAEMVRALIGECKKGHYQGMKFLFEVAGIFPAAVAETPSTSEPSFAEILCKQLGLPDEMPADPEVTDDCPNEQHEAIHPVE